MGLRQRLTLPTREKYRLLDVMYKTQLLLNTLVTQSATFIFVKFLKNFLKIIQEPLVKRHRFCVYCVPFIKCML